MTHLHDRTTRRWFVRALGLAFCLLVIVLSPAGASSNGGTLAGYLAALPRSLTFTFRAGEHQIVAQEVGAVAITMDGFEPAGLPGDPQLPAAYPTIALPPFVPLDSVAVTIDRVEQVDLPGGYDVVPVGPLRPAGGDQPAVADWGPNAATVVDGRNTAVYGRDAAFPAAPVELLGVAQMRQWRMARLRFWPVSYNPVSGQLRLTTAVTVTVRYDAPAPGDESPAALRSTTADDRAAALFLNFDEAQGWYKDAPVDPQQPAEAVPTYAIVTTNWIFDVARPGISRFFYHKTAEGWRVHILTEDDYGEYPGDRPEQVRQFLRDNYVTQNYDYVLLIGDPNPDDPEDTNDSVGDLPMKMFATISGYYPSDFYFADLSDPGGQMDWQAEVFVGRIPVYQSQEEWGLILSQILDKTIAYETSSDVTWRRSALLAMGFLGATIDAGPLGEHMKNDYLDATGFSTRRLYWHGALSNSSWSEGELVDGAIRAALQDTPAGVLAWSGHGGHGNVTTFENYSSYMNEQGKEVLSTPGLSDMLVSEETRLLDDRWPTLTFQASCQTGWPEDPNNLAYALLRRGAVGTVAGSRNTYSLSPDPGSGTENASLAYHYIRRVVDNVPIGKALYKSKSNSTEPRNSLAYNLYGDPSLTLLGGPLNEQAAEPEPATNEVTATARPTALAQDSAPFKTPTATAPAMDVTGPTAPAAAGAGHPRGAAFDPELLLTVGGAHGCALQASGDVACWQINGNIANYWHADLPDAPGPYVQIVASFYNSCGLRADGSVNCWGRDRYDFHMEDRPGPYVQLSLKYLHVCGLRPDGRAECWGDNSAGQSDAPDESFIQVSAGMQHTCGLRANGSVKCWGRNAYGQALEPEGPFVQIDTSYFHTCGLRPDGRADCWGANHHGQSFNANGPFIQVSTGMFLSCGLRPDGSVECWGKHAQNQPGPFLQIAAFEPNCGLKRDHTIYCWDHWGTANLTGPYAPYAAPFDANDPASQTVLAAGANHSCGLRSSGSVECWGDSQYGQSVTRNGLFKAVETGDNHTCALGLDGKAVCWGQNDKGQATGQDGPFVQLTAGATHNCALRADGRAECWGGSGNAGKLEDRPGPYVEIASGRSHNCAIRTDGTLDCWGDEDNGQLDYPAGQFHQIAAGGDHSCALNTMGELECWGINSHGQVVERLGPYTQVSAGERHTCALRTDGRVECWGDNSDGQSNPPAGPFVRLAAGGSHTCGLRPDGRVVCWGDSDFGQTSPKSGFFGPYVPPVNHPPVAAGQTVSTPLNRPVTITLSVSDADGDSLTYTIVQRPRHGQLTGTAPRLVYTPAAGYYGFDRFTYKVNDGQADSNVAAVDITVTPAAYWELFLPFIDRK